MVAGDVARVAKTAGFTLFSLLTGVAILIIGFVMLKGVFSKATAFLGIVTGIALIVGGAITPVTPYYVPIIVSGPFILIWSIAVGYKLYRLG